MNLKKLDALLTCLSPLISGIIAGGLGMAFPLRGFALLLFGGTYALMAWCIWTEKQEKTLFRAVYITHMLSGICILLWGIAMCFPMLLGFGLAGAVLLAFFLVDREMEQLAYQLKDEGWRGFFKHALMSLPLLGCIFAVWLAPEEEILHQA